MSDPARVPEFVRHMLEAIDRISAYTDGLSLSDFAASTLVQDAVIRNSEIPGEAARNIETADPAFAQAYPQIPLRDIYLMSNRLAHGYFSVDIALVWNAVKTDIPSLRTEILALHGTP